MFRRSDKSKDSGRQHQEFHLVVSETPDYDALHERSVTRNGLLRLTAMAGSDETPHPVSLAASPKLASFFGASVVPNSC
jgi:hypothetical protein